MQRQWVSWRKDHNLLVCYFVPSQNNCNSGRTGDQISQLHRQVEDVRGIMAQNIERVVERGDRLDSLLEKTQDLEQAVS